MIWIQNKKKNGSVDCSFIALNSINYLSSVSKRSLLSWKVLINCSKHTLKHQSENGLGIIFFVNWVAFYFWQLGGWGCWNLAIPHIYGWWGISVQTGERNLFINRFSMITFWGNCWLFLWRMLSLSKVFSGSFVKWM
jgi:hypothetical protein